MFLALIITDILRFATRDFIIMALSYNELLEESDDEQDY